jgi:hypothetical protein
MTVVEMLVKRLKPTLLSRWEGFEKRAVHMHSLLKESEVEGAFRSGMEIGYWQGVREGLTLGIEIPPDQISQMTHDTGL